MDQEKSESEDKADGLYSYHSLSGDEKEKSEDKLEATRPPSPQYDRAQLIKSFQSIADQEKRLKKQNRQLQKKLAIQFQLRKIDDFVITSADVDMADLYKKALAEIKELWEKEVERREKHLVEENALRQVLTDKQDHIDDFMKEFRKQKKEIALNAINSYTNQKIPIDVINAYMDKEAVNDEKVRKLRLQHIKEKCHLQNLQNDLQRRKVGTGEDAVQYQQYRQLRTALQINQMQLEKQKQEYAKMEDVFTELIQLSTHATEKLEILKPDAYKSDQYLRELSEEVLAKTELLSELKCKRKVALHQLEKLKRHYGILSNNKFVKHYDTMHHLEHDIRVQITEQKNRYRRVKCILATLSDSKS